MSRVAIVSGAGSGIGAATARLLAARGLTVVLVGRQAEALEAVAADLPGPSLTVALDLARPESPAQIAERALSAFGRIDVVVNNAAVIRTGPLEAITRESFDEHYAVNVAAPMFLLAAALPALRSGEDPAIVNVSSSVGSIVKAGNMLYGSTKASLEYLTRAWAYELAPEGIRVNCVAPGPVDTPIHATYTDDLAAAYTDLARRIPLSRMGHVDDIAAWVWFLVSAETAWTTGNVVHADGGQVLGLPVAAGG